MGKRYKQLSLEERCLLQTQLSLGFRPARIAAGLKRARSTITREMRRNGWRPEGQRADRGRPPIAGGYYAPFAEKRARRLHRKARTARKLVPGSCLWQTVLEHLGKGLSPEQIACTLGRMSEPVLIKTAISRGRGRSSRSLHPAHPIAGR